MRLIFWIALPAAAATVIQDVNVVDVASASLRPHMNVVVEGDRIKSVGAAPAAGARVVNGRGKFLIPGLWDMHVHLWDKMNPLPMYVAFGVTGVQDMGSDFSRVSAWRDAIEQGKAIGPHVITSGPPVDGQASEEEKLPVLIARTPDEARQAFDKLWDMDVDFIKVLSGLSRDAYFALAEQARHWDMRMVGHVPSSVTAWEAIEARQRSLEHLFGVMQAVSTDAEAVRFFEACAVRGVRITPTLTMWRRSSRDYERVARLAGLTTQTKVEVLAGTDTGDPGTLPGATLHDELEELVKAGFSPHQALRAATVAPAEFLGWESGTVEKGMAADLVLLDANPLVDIANTRKIVGVVVRGKYFSRGELERQAGLKAGSPAPQQHR